MLKKTVILMLCALPMFALAQDKFGHVNSQEILMAMPERVTIENTLDTLQTQWENEMVKMREEYLAKIKEFQDKQATMPESIKQARQSEIVDLEQRISTFNQTASADLQQKQQELSTFNFQLSTKKGRPCEPAFSVAVIFLLVRCPVSFSPAGSRRWPWATGR